MTSPPKVPTLMPANATPRERALAAVEGRLDQRAAEADVITTLLDPATCPLAFLPYLAYARSVDVYDPAWPEATKRAVIAAAPLVHALKGTPAAVKAALAALQVDATVTEWWETAPKGRPYTFSVRAGARARLYDGPILDQRLTRAVFASVMAVKPLSRAFDLVVAAAMPTGLGLAPVALGAVKVRTALHPERTPETFATGLGLAPVALGRVRVRALFTGSP